MKRIRVTMEFDTTLDPKAFKGVVKRLTAHGDFIPGLVYLATETVPEITTNDDILYDRRHWK